LLLLLFLLLLLHLQEVGRQVLSTTCTTAAGKLAAAAAAVSKLSAAQLSEGVGDLVESPEDAPDALLSLLAGGWVGGSGGGGGGRRGAGYIVFRGCRFFLSEFVICLCLWQVGCVCVWGGGYADTSAAPLLG
jgi:hypothetical protein